MWRRLLPLTLAEWRHHPWRHLAALLAVALGVALASSVQTINASALAEFAQAVRAVNGEPDVVLAADGPAGFDEALYGRVATQADVLSASPLVEADAPLRRPGGEAVALRVLGVDVFSVAHAAPALLPRPAADNSNASGGVAEQLAPDAAYLNAAALRKLQLAVGGTLELRTPGGGWQRLRVAGHVAAGGAALVVLDIAAAQAALGHTGRLQRIDVRLAPGVDRAAWLAHLAQPALPAGVHAAQADDAVQRVSNLSRAYRVNLGVLALVALLVGGFLVYSVVALSVAQRLPQLALLGVLGLAAADRRRWIVAESLLVGLAGSVLGLALGAGLSLLALRLLGGDLGGGYFPNGGGAAPQVAWPWGALLACVALGTLAAVVGAWRPARLAERIAPAQALKGLGLVDEPKAGDGWRAAAPGLALVLAGGLAALAPPVQGLPLAAYAAVALLLAGGVSLVPATVALLLLRQRAPTPRALLGLLALRRARFARATASATVAGVVASLALSVAITVMVSSFRLAVDDWLGAVLPADLYARSASSSSSSNATLLPEGLVAVAAALPGVARVQAGRTLPMVLSADQPAVALVARPLGDDPARALPLLGALAPPAASAPGTATEVGVYISEPAAALYGWQVGDTLQLPVDGLRQATLRVRGVWRDYARQFGAVAMDLADYQRLTGDLRHNDLALWLTPGADAAAVTDALKAAAGKLGDESGGGSGTAGGLPLETISTRQLRLTSLAIFDRSFAVTVYLQVVAIAVGLAGVAASLSAQVLARRKEFGLLAHLGFTRSQVMRLVALETTTWLASGVAVGLALGVAMAVVLVKVVNPQSFHWSMPLHLPAGRLALLAGSVLLAGMVTALLSARHAAGRRAVLAVKEDW